ncbi:4-oxalocrotonate decarboxylase [Lampropedia hyalina DSM 16112]|jgi:2-oxo-3-hexenedioate decarboxylase|uniref:4-oxalocrotonate decarboxylase n=1 Tax=Lampropedia hyalina DSM 16112 TaxID=1122156 RepID=A0A1M4Y8F7_9BURK|nr:2-oxo-3-hexenedioate decarboxylase [Lampropedia hyalina]SHF01742.1 4-oxalocrotonate decarboxylase [Lampropedia hyalina DSM 16112]
MSLSPTIIRELADTVQHAQDHAHTIEKLTIRHPELSIADGYAVQDELRRRWQVRGERVTGFKAGLTSRAKMEQMGVHVPGFGILTNAMARPENSAIDTRELIHPRVEAEIAFVLREELRGPGHSIEDVLAATDFVIPALEVIDSRFEKFKFDLESVIADNSSSSRYASGGRPRNPRDLDLRTVGVVIEKNGEIQASGAGAAVLNHPANAIVLLLEHLAARGEYLPAGSFILTGAITEAIAVSPGDSIVARFQNMGSVSLHFV